MIKRYFLFFLAAAFLSVMPVRAQMVVTVPTLEATNITGFLNQLEQTLNTLTAVKGQFELAKQGLEVISKVNTWISRSQYLTEAAQILAEATDLAKQSYDMMIDKKLYSARSISKRLTNMTAQLSRATAGFTLVMQAMSIDMKGSDADRYEMIERGLSIAQQSNDLIRAWLNDDMAVARLDGIITNDIEYVEPFEYPAAMRATANADNPIYMHIPSVVSVASTVEQITAEMLKSSPYINEDITYQTEAENAATDQTGSASKNLIKSRSGNVILFFYAVCALMFLLGSGNVYMKFINGDDIYRPIAYWFISIIGTFIIGNIVDNFLK